MSSAAAAEPDIAWLARLLQQAGTEVDVVMTRAATEFVGAVTLEALTGRPVHTALIAAGHALDHIRIARAADVVVVAPCTADFLARAVHGQADDLLSACLLATTAPVESVTPPSRVAVPAVCASIRLLPPTMRSREDTANARTFRIIRNAP